MSSLPIEIIVNGKAANDAATISEENTRLRWRIRELEASPGADPRSAATVGWPCGRGHQERQPKCPACHDVVLAQAPAGVERKDGLPKYSES